MEFLRCRRTSSVKAMTETQNADVNQENESLNRVLSSSTLTDSSDYDIFVAFYDTIRWTIFSWVASLTCRMEPEKAERVRKKTTNKKLRCSEETVQSWSPCRAISWVNPVFILYNKQRLDWQSDQLSEWLLSQTDQTLSGVVAVFWMTVTLTADTPAQVATFRDTSEARWTLLYTDQPQSTSTVLQFIAFFFMVCPM